MSFAFDLASRVNQIRLDALPPEAIRVATASIADTIGVAVAGASEVAALATAEVLDLNDASGPCLILGRTGRGTALDAALVNGAAAHALDFDDCSTTMGGHPSAPVVPAILALGEEIGASGPQLIEAFVAGVETETRLARGLLPVHYDKGWHPTATLGVFGAAAACGRLMGLDTERLATALAIAVSFACGIKANFGTPTKPLHVGIAARNGLLAALLARQGLSANATAFEQEQGFFEVFNGAGNYDPDAILSGWSDDLELLRPGLAIKQHPCCGSAHSAIDAALKLRARIGKVDRNAIADIRTTTHARRLAHTNRPDPRSNLDAKFSVQYLTLRALVDGQIRLDHFEGNSIQDPAIRGLLGHIEAQAHTGSNEYLGRVAIRFRDGTVLTEEATTPFGRGPLNPMSRDELRMKFEDCAVRAISPRAARRLFDTLMDLEHVEELGIVAEILAPGAQEKSADRRVTTMA